jgi:hypothetical protein
MTRDQAVAGAQRRQASHPEAKWVAARRGGEWVLARIGLEPDPIRASGTTVQAPPLAPHDASQSELQRVVTQYGSGG